VKRLAVEQVGRLRQKIAGLQAMVATLETLADCCAGDDRPDYPILKDLEAAPAGPAPHGPPIFGRP
jgi:MerR family gold-responsive transcriptional activator of gol and ges genes